RRDSSSASRESCMTFSRIQIHHGPRVASIVLNGPALDVIYLHLLVEFESSWDEIEDLRAQVAVISGAGERAFSAGVDVADHAPSKIETMLERFHNVIILIAKAH